MTTTTFSTMTVRDLGNLADERGVKPSELLPPAGYELDEDSVGRDGQGVWEGPDVKGEGWLIMSQWTLEHGLTFWVDGDGDNAIPASEAVKLSAALAEVARLAV